MYIPETVLTTRFSYRLCSGPFSVAAVASCLVGEVMVDEVVDDVDPWLLELVCLLKKILC